MDWKRTSKKNKYFWMITIICLLMIPCSNATEVLADANNDVQQEKISEAKDKKSKKKKKKSKKKQKKSLEEKVAEAQTAEDKIKIMAEYYFTNSTVEVKGDNIYIIKTPAPNFKSAYSYTIPSNFASILKIIQKEKIDYQAIFLDVQIDLIDDKGQESTNGGLIVCYDKSTMDNINLDNWPASPEMVYTAATAYEFYPYVWNNEVKDKLKEKINRNNGIAKLPDNLFFIYTDLFAGK